MFGLKKNSNILKVSVVDEIKTKDITPEEIKTSVVSQKESTPKVLTEEEKIKIKAEYNRLMDRYVPPHNIKSKKVTAVDIPTILTDGADLIAMCQLPRGHYKGILALAHSQINDKNPLRFFVLPSGFIIINPFIINHTQTPVFKEEGCMSYPDDQMKEMLPRYHKITVKYQTLIKKDEEKEPSLGPFTTDKLSGKMANIFQHETTHLNGYNIYDENFDPQWSIGFGDGLPVSPEIGEDIIISK